MSVYGIEDEALVFRDEKTFFQIVQTTPDWVEAQDLLNRARTAAIRCKVIADQRDDLAEVERYNGLLSKLNAELKIVNVKIANTDWYEAVKAVCGPDVAKQCYEWRIKQRRLGL